MKSRVWMVYLACAVTGCATIKEARTVVDGERTTRVDRTPSPDAPPMVRLGRLPSGGYVLTARSSGRCEEREVVTVAQEARVERTMEVEPALIAIPIIPGVLGISALVVGISMAGPPDPSSQSMLTPEERQGVAIGSSIVGGALLLGAAALIGVELYRARDSVEPLPSREETYARAVACDTAPLTGAELLLQADGRTIATGTTDRDGSLQIAKASLNSTAARLTARVFDKAVPVEVDAAAAVALAELREEERQREAEKRAAMEVVREKERQQRVHEEGLSALSAARLALQAGDVLEARKQYAIAEGKGATDTLFAGRLEAAVTMEAKKKIAAAWNAVKKGDLDAATEAATAANDLGGTDEKLDAALQARRVVEERYQGENDALNRALPPEGTGRRVDDWGLFLALSEGDAVEVLKYVDKSFADRLDAATGYEAEQLQRQVKKDATTRAMLNRMRSKIAGTTFYVPIEKPRVEYDRTFTLFWASPMPGDDRISQAVILDGLTVLGWRRYECWQLKAAMLAMAVGANPIVCGAKLDGMPQKLQRVAEREVGDSIQARWRWRGVETTIAAKRTSVVTGETFIHRRPSHLALEFVDSNGSVLWAAE